ncbi:MAG: ABC transporter ATP-binding protein [Candidatus Methanogranum gryphiswaldense]|nr:MAG: ABC transporter ATP-binding protein [Candidatus Methanogranum sp. U3.2.1]
MTLKVRDLKFYYDKKIVLDGIDLDIREGELLGILGPNGCGKTTLLKNLNKNLSPHEGCVLIDDTDLEELSKKEVAKTIAVVPQTNEIRFAFTVKDIVSMGRLPFTRAFEGESHKDIDIINSAMQRTGICEFSERYINTMSGGERQRVIIARALAQTPKILLMDEPTLHLDINTQFDVLDLVYELSKKENLAVVVVSHDLAMVARYCDRIVLIKDHKIHSMGTLDEVLTPENMDLVFGVDAELSIDEKTGKRTVVLHGSTKRL